MKDLKKFILENTVVDFGKATSNYGECIILAGGGGSGKGFIKNRINANFRTYDVDDLKLKYTKLLQQGKLQDKLKDFDFSNPDDVTELHMRVKQHGWKDKQINLIFRNKSNPNKEASNSKILPNLLFDKVSDKIDDITEIALRAKTLGYNVHVVWVLCNIETAKMNNKIRSRYIDEDKILIPAHKRCYENMTKLFNNGYAEFNDFIDSAWIGYSAGFGRKLSGKYEKSPIIEIKKDKNGKFIFNQETMVDNFLKEQQPINYEELKDNLKYHKRVEMTKKFCKLNNIDIEKEAA